MALVLANRVQETATPNTTVSFTLTGAVSGFQTFAVIGNTNTTYYSATDTAGNWEVGEGTYSTTGPTLTRTTVYASSNSGSAVTFPGSVNVFVTYPSGKSVNLDGAGNVSALGTVTSGTWQGSTVGVAYGGTGLTSYTLNGVVYASGTGTLATGSALTFDGTNLINSGVYTAPSNGSGAGTKTTVQGSTGTGQAGASGGNGFIELIGGGGTSTWTSFTGVLPARRRGGINLQAGTAQGDAGGTYVSGSTINISGSAGTNNGTTAGVGSQIAITSGSTTKTDGLTSGASVVSLSSPNSTVSSSVTLTAGIFSTSTGNNAGAGIAINGALAGSGGSISLQPGLASASGSISGKAYVVDPATSTSHEIITTKFAATPTDAGIVFGLTNASNTALGASVFACGTNGVALGNGAGVYGNGIAIGKTAYAFGCGAINIGRHCGSSTGAFGNNSITIGRSAVTCSSATNSIAIGTNASAYPANSIAIGANVVACSACQTHIGPVRNVCSTSGLQGLFYNACTKEVIRGAVGVPCATPSVAGIVFGKTDINCTAQNTTLGYQANSIGSNSTAVGYQATTFGSSSIAIGASAYTCFSVTGAVVIGYFAAGFGGNSVAVGNGASAGASGIAIGGGAAALSNSIVINASGSSLSCVAPSRAYIAPIRSVCCTSGLNSLFYDATTKEVIQAAGGGGGVCCATPTVAGKVYGKTETFCCANGNTLLGYSSSAACAAGGVTVGASSTTASYGTAVGKCANAGYASVAVGINAKTNGHCFAVAIGPCASATGPGQTHITQIRNAAGPFTLRYNPCSGEVTYN